MNIAIIVSSLGNGGAERIAGLLSMYLAKRYSVYLFLEFTDENVYEYSGQIVDIGVDGWDYTEHYVEVYKKKYAIDCAISFLQRYNFMNVRTRYTEKVIISERNAVLLYNPRLYYNEIMIKRYYCEADAVVAISEGVNQELVNSFALEKKKVHTIYNFFDAEAVRRKAEIEEDNGIDESFYKGKKLIVNIGRLENPKNQKRLLFQFADLHKQDSNTRLLIIGSGVLQEQLEEIIGKLALREVVKICPYCRNPFYLLRQASLFVFSSRHEGWGNVLLEAMSLGIPVVSVDCFAGPREIIAEDANYKEYISEWEKYDKGILVTRNDSENEGETLHLSHAMRFCLNNKEYVECAKQAALNYINNYSNEKLLKQWLVVIEQTKILGKASHEEKINPSARNVVYGAGEYGRKVIQQLLHEGKEISAVVVSEPDENPTEVFGVPVVGTEFLTEYKNDINVYLGVSFIYIDEVCGRILGCGIPEDNIIAVKVVPNGL